jgi:hypothetical protein
MKMMFLGAAVTLSVVAANADVVSDQAAAIVIWPDIKADAVAGVDTIVQLSNTSPTQSVLVHCFYENANSHCTNSGQVCEGPLDCCETATGCGICQPGWLETDFRIRLTPRQPLGWNASVGLVDFPLTGRFGSVGPDGSSNAGSRIPPAAEDPYTGALKCIAVNDDGTPSDRNVLKGESTLVNPNGDVAKHNAVGIKALEGAVNDDNQLILGGEGAEYNGCSNFLIVNHMFDLGIHPLIDVVEVPSLTNIVLVPCTQDLLRQIPGRAIVQFLVYNEFEQRFSTSRTADCKADWRLSEIDTTDPTRSIFSAGVAGTLVGQSRLNPIGSGFIGIANEQVGEDEGAFQSISSFNLNLQGDRAESDIITIIP